MATHSVRNAPTEKLLAYKAVIDAELAHRHAVATITTPDPGVPEKAARLPRRWWWLR